MSGYNYITCTASSTNWAGYSVCTSTSATYTCGTYYVYPGTTWVSATMWNEPIPETGEQRANREAEHQRQREENQRRQEEREADVKVAEELLKQHIGVERFGVLYQVGHIEVDSQKYKGRKYRIPNNEQMIDVLDENDKILERLCIHTAIDCPMPDRILTRLILAESAEEILLAKANHHGI